MGRERSSHSMTRGRLLIIGRGLSDTAGETKECVTTAPFSHLTKRRERPAPPERFRRRAGLDRSDHGILEDLRPLAEQVAAAGVWPGRVRTHGRRGVSLVSDLRAAKARCARCTPWGHDARRLGVSLVLDLRADKARCARCISLQACTFGRVRREPRYHRV